MFKVLRKNSAIALALVAGISVSNQPLHAEWTATNYAEAATGVLRGIGSKFEYDVKHDSSKRAHLTRLLVSALRVTHGALAITNHSGDYQSYYLHTLTALDGAQGLAYGAQWLNEQEEEILLDESIEPVCAERLEFVRKYALPALESFAAVLVACTGNGDVASQKALFTGQALLALARTCQTSLDQEQGWVKNTIGTLVLVNAVYASYQLLHEESGLNTWMVNEKKRIDEERIRIEAEEKQKVDQAAREHWNAFNAHALDNLGKAGDLNRAHVFNLLEEQQRIEQAQAAQLEQERLAEQQRQEQEAQAALEREQEVERQRQAQAELEAAQQREQEAERQRQEEERRQNVLNALRLREEQAAENERIRLEEEAILRRQQEELEAAKKLEKETERQRRREAWEQQEREAQDRRLAEQQRQEELAVQQRKEEEQRLADLEAAKLQKKQALLEAQQQREAQATAAQRQQIAEIKEKDEVTAEDLKALRGLHALALQQGSDDANDIFETIKDLTIIKNNKDKQKKIEAKNNRLKRFEAKK